MKVQGGAVKVKNNDSFSYDYCFLGINSTLGYSSDGGIAGGWRARSGTIAAGKTVSIPLSSFANDDNQRFNVFSTKIQNVLIWCASGNKSGLSSLGDLR